MLPRRLARTPDKIAKTGLSLSAIVNLRSRSYYDNQQKVVGYSGLFQRHRRCHQEKLNKPDLQVKLIGHLAEPYPVVAEWHL